MQEYVPTLAAESVARLINPREAEFSGVSPEAARQAGVDFTSLHDDVMLGYAGHVHPYEIVAGYPQARLELQHYPGGELRDGSRIDYVFTSRESRYPAGSRGKELELSDSPRQLALRVGEPDDLYMFTLHYELDNTGELMKTVVFPYEESTRNAVAHRRALNNGASVLEADRETVNYAASRIANRPRYRVGRAEVNALGRLIYGQ